MSALKLPSQIHQGIVLNQLKAIFPDIIINDRKSSTLKYASGSYMELDFLIPKLNLCIEFQDSYHYVSTWYYQSPKSEVYKRDNRAQNQGLSLVIIPCWWDGSLDRLTSTILFQRPDLFPTISPSIPIQFNPPSNHFSETYIPNVGELMLASFPADFKSFSVTNDTWWMGEKYDGVRFCWNPIEFKLYTRNGRIIQSLPSCYTDQLPFIFIDGELWFGRGQFSSTFNLLTQETEISLWEYLRLIQFDIPSHNFTPYEDRYAELMNATDDNNFILTVPRVMCKSGTHLKNYVQEIIDTGGEGAILQKCNSVYVQGRTQNLLKLKVAQGDKEGIVIGIGRNNSVILKMPDGTTFEVAADSVMIPTPKLGTIVTFSYQSYSRREVPVGPKIYRIRTDVTWPEIVANDTKDKVYLNEHSSVKGFTSQPQRHWTLKRMRLFLEKFARIKNLDPTKAESWYNSYRDLIKLKGGRTIVQKFKGGYRQALKSVFPDISFDPTAFAHSSWTTAESRRKFFERYALQNNFDSQIPENWAKQYEENIMATKGAKTIASYYQSSISKALVNLFPDIGLDPLFQFPTVWDNEETQKNLFEEYARDYQFDSSNPENWYSQFEEAILLYEGADRILQNYLSIERALLHFYPNIGLQSNFRLKSIWDDEENRKMIFENIAQDLGFNPYISEFWYMQHTETLMEYKWINKVLSFHGNSIVKALNDLFPDLKLDPNIGIKSMWFDADHRREFFENYARENKFDPLITDHWYSQNREKIMAQKGAYSVMSHYGNSVANALISLFPKLPFELSKFQIRSPWYYQRYRRKFFEEYAKENEFDPLIPDHWYSQYKEKIMGYKGAQRVIAYHDNSIEKALLDLFPEIGLSDSFKVKSYWEQSRNQRRFFSQYALENEFDPLCYQSWILQPREKILSAKGGKRVLSFYNNSVTSALLSVFPEMKQISSKLVKSMWQDKDVHKRFFKEYAENKGFHYLNSEQWSSQSNQSIMSSKGASSIMVYYNNNFKRALSVLFPELKLEMTKFRAPSWWDNVENRKMFFINYAKANNFEPSISENWNQQFKENILSFKGARNVISYHKNNLSQALHDLFPELNNLIEFQSFWNVESNRKNFFINYAKTNSFDPFVPSNWYTQSVHKIREAKDANTVLGYHENNLPKALVDLFPNSEFDKNKFQSTMVNPWSDKDKQRQFFIDYAEKKEFDYNLVDNWYREPLEDIMETRGANVIMAHYGNSVAAALSNLFHDSNFDSSKFQPMRLWQDVATRKEFFEKFAKQHSFDACNPEHWYSQSKKQIMSTKGAFKVIFFHKKSISKALLDLFPNIGLDKTKLNVLD